jgi:hypothetical protein
MSENPKISTADRFHGRDRTIWGDRLRNASQIVGASVGPVMAEKVSVEATVKEIRRGMRRNYFAGEKVRIVLAGLRGRRCSPR